MANELIVFPYVKWTQYKHNFVVRIDTEGYRERLKFALWGDK